MSLLRRYLPLATLFAAIASFYLYNLNGVGLLGPDEPRYAAVGQAMAKYGDWITPHLWGVAWFEKPPLLYWLTAAGVSLGLDPELSARLPISLLSLLFLCVFFVLARAEFGGVTAGFSAVALASSAAWIVYSNLGLTDLPLACFFSLAILIPLPLLRTEARSSPGRWILSGMCLGAAVLAKGLVPLVLIAPSSWFFRRYWRHWWIAATSLCAISLPWYIAVYRRNGWPFVEDFFLKQHFQRLYSTSLQHVQPWYFYFPILLGALFPWTPLLGLLMGRLKWDQRRLFLLSTTAFGFLFFSLSLNKLPGYLLPLIPAIFLLIGSAFEGKPILAISTAWLVPCALLISCIPLVAQALPSLLSAGRLVAFSGLGLSATSAFYVAAPLAVMLLARRSWRGVLLTLCLIAGGFYIKFTAYPVLDQRVSARVFWKQRIEPIQNQVCEQWIKRDWVYGLGFYRGAAIPSCFNATFRYHLMPKPRTLPAIDEVKP